MAPAHLSHFAEQLSVPPDVSSDLSLASVINAPVGEKCHWTSRVSVSTARVVGSAARDLAGRHATSSI